MRTPASTAVGIAIFDELFEVEQEAARARRGWLRLIVLIALCGQIAISTFAWRAYADANYVPPPPPMPTVELVDAFTLPAGR